MKHYAENLGSNVGAMIKVRQVVNFFCFLIIIIFLEPLKLGAVSETCPIQSLMSIQLFSNEYFLIIVCFFFITLCIFSVFQIQYFPSTNNMPPMERHLGE